MGQGQQKPTINPNAQQTTVNTANNSNAKDQKFLNYIREALRNCSSGGYVTRDSFNQVLAVLQNFGFKRLRDTPLADRLFKLVDSNNSGRVPVDSISKTINDVINDRNSALMYTFKAYDMDGDNRVSRKEFVQLIQDSWRAAFRILAEKCENGQNGKLTIRDLQNWAASKVQNLNQLSGKLFNKLDSNGSGYIEYQAFKQFATGSGYNDIEASMNGDKVCIPLNLTALYAN